MGLGYKKLVVFILVLFSCVKASFAQLSRTHYIPPITVSTGSNATPENQYLHISTPSVSVVNLTLTQMGGAVTSHSVSNASPLEISIGSGDNTPFIAAASITSSKINNKGYSIQADAPVYASIRLVAGAQAGSIVSKGLAGLGTTFRVGTFTNLKTFTSNNDYLNFVTVLATENNTQVDFSDLSAGVVIRNNTPLSVLLNAGESYVVALDPAVAPANRDGLIGALVRSTKPIVVNCGSTNGSNATGGGRDYGIDQIAPFETIQIDGQSYSEYIFVRANGFDAIERPLIVAHLDNTEVYVNGDNKLGTLLATLSAGEYISIEGSNFSTQSVSGSNPGGNMYVWTSKTAFAYQGIGGSNSEANQELFFVPPLNCETPRVIDNIPQIQHAGTGSATFAGGITIVAEMGASVEVNGAPITVAPASVTGNANYITYVLTGLSGNVSLVSDKQLYVSYYGANGPASLGGFYSGFIFKPEISSSSLDIAVTELCIPNIELNINGFETYDSYQWYFNGTPISGATSNAYTPTDSGYYQLEGILTDCKMVLSDNIPVSSCAGDTDGDGVNDDVDLDVDNDGNPNTAESNCSLNFDLSKVSDPNFTSNIQTSLNNTAVTPFEGFSNQSMVFRAEDSTTFNFSTTTYELNFNVPTSFKIEQATVISGVVGDLDDQELYVISVPYDQTITVLNPDNQLLIDVNYDGIYDSNITEFTAFEIRFKVNSASLSVGSGTFSFQSNLADRFSIQYTNTLETDLNAAAFQLTLACRPIDSDGDLLSDALDLDSDNDGIYDVTENGNSLLDQNQDGVVDAITSNDSNGDGWHDAAVVAIDTDADSVFDYLDLDADNDGLYDLFEAGVEFGTLDLDADGQIDIGFIDANLNGMSDAAESNIPIDSDANLIPDFVQLDSDVDGCFDVDEAGFKGTLGILDGTGIDSKGLIIGGNGYTAAKDTNGDGVFDYQENTLIIPSSISTPLAVCELGDTAIKVSLETDSATYDRIEWEWSSDAGVSWANVPETPSSFEGVKTNTIEILQTPLSLSNTIFRARMERLDYACGPIFTNEIELIVNPLPTVQSIVQLFQCDVDTDGITAFNLNEANELISTNHTNETFTFYHTNAEAVLGDLEVAIPNPLSYVNASTDPAIDPNTLFVRVETLFGCTRISELKLVVSTTTIPSTYKTSSSPYEECYDKSDGKTTFDFSDSEADIRGMFPTSQSLTITYYETEATALSETAMITDPSNYDNTTGSNQSIWVRIDSDVDNSCIGLGTYVDLIVNPLPAITIPVANPYYCVDVGTSLTKNLETEFNATLLGPQSPIQYSVRYYETKNNAETLLSPLTTVSNTSATQKVFVRIENNTTNCFDIDPFIIDFIDNPQAFFVAPFEACDLDNDGVFEFDASGLEAAVFKGQTTMVVDYFDSSGLPLKDSNGIKIQSPFPSTFSTSTQTIRAIVSNAFCADAFVDIDFVVHPNTDFLVDDVVICDGASERIELDLEYPSNTYLYRWVLPDLSIVMSVNPELLASQIGAYSVTVSNLDGSCLTTQNFEVFASEGPTISMEDITVVEATSVNSITIFESNLGSANYEFKLVDESGVLVSGYQDEGYFGNLTGGFYTLYVRDDLRCEEVSITIPVLYFPKFITPNGDGYNDEWKIKGIQSSKYQKGQIFIFNRYGKLLKSMSIHNNSWNGTFNGTKLTASDYWFRIEFLKLDGTFFSSQGHFSLKY